MRHSPPAGAGFDGSAPASDPASDPAAGPASGPASVPASGSNANPGADPAPDPGADPAPDPGAGPAPDPDVSILIPAWRAEPFLERALRSALAQTGPSLEVIVFDDASPDGTAALAERIAAEDPRVRVIRSPVNVGPGAGRNAAAREARGRWLALLDADDAYRPGRLARLVALAEAEGLDAVADLPVFYDLAADAPAPTQLPADGSLELLTPRGFLEAAVLPGSKLDYGLLQPIYRRALVEQGLWRFPEDARHGEDFLGFLDSMTRGVRIGLLHEAGYVYSTRIGETSGAWSPGSVTHVDYRAVAADTRALIARLERERPEIPGMTLDEAVALLRRRIDKCLGLNARYGWNTLRKGAWRRHAAWLAQDPRNGALLLSMAAGKLIGRLRGRGGGGRGGGGTGPGGGSGSA